MKKYQKNMEQATNRTMNLLEKHNTVTLLENKDFEKVTVSGMKFVPVHYKIEGVGHLQVMTMNGGLMGMYTLVITPFKKNLPLLSLDFIYLPFGSKVIVELYDIAQKDEAYKSYLDKFQTVKTGYNTLKNSKKKPAWYDDLLTVAMYKKGVKDDELLHIIESFVGLYVNMSDSFPTMDEEASAEKIAKIEEYQYNLIKKGGVSTDQFKKTLGDAMTQRFFEEIFFGTVYASEV